jgi:hypothetical protein
MELYINTATKACSIHPEHVSEWAHLTTGLLKLNVSREVFETLTAKVSLEQYFEMADELIKASGFTKFDKSEFKSRQ